MHWGSGDVHLNSPLNAPLDAEIELVNATPEDLATLEAKLASKETFARYGLDWPPFMASVTVTRDRSANGGQVLRIKSTETVTEPFLTLLIEASWARGRLVREYTVLLDPPVFAPNSVARARRSAAAVPSAAAQSIGPDFPSRAAGTAASAAPRAGRWRRQLRSAARRQSVGHRAPPVREHRRAAPSQLMVSIYRGNSRRVRRRHEPPARGLRAAYSEQRRNRRRLAVRSQRRSAPPRGWLVRVGAARRRRPPAPGAAERLGAEPAALRRGNAAEVDAAAGPRARARRPAHRIQAHARAAQYRTCRSAGQAGRLAAAARRPRSSGARRPPRQPLPQPEAADADAGSRHARSRRRRRTPRRRRPSPPRQLPPSRRRPRPPQTAEGDVARRQADRATGGSSPPSSLLIIGLLVAKSRGKRKTAEFDDNLGRLADARRRPPGAAAWIRSPTPAACARRTWAHIPDDILVEESGTHRALQETQDIPLAPTVRTDETISSETAVNLDQGDPLAEADFHMAYGLYDQAADLVRIAIQREPDRRDLKLKLLEVFFVWGNKEQFLTMARELADTRGEVRRGRVGKDRHHGQADRPRRFDVLRWRRRRRRGGRRSQSRCRRCRPRRLRSVRCQRSAWT